MTEILDRRTARERYGFISTDDEWTPEQAVAVREVGGVVVSTGRLQAQCTTADGFFNYERVYLPTPADAVAYLDALTPESPARFEQA